MSRSEPTRIWADGAAIFGVRRIAPLESTDAPVVNSQSNPTFLWSQKCAYAFGVAVPVTEKFFHVQTGGL
jgi:hypothetical protein